ncbi:MAG TPA: VOC family protein [Noviherbaspirillum sp.]|nr:VOC family protein [Noviherbaspirillum sp.]
MAAIPPFHLAFPVHDLDAARHFYGEVLGCAEGRSSPDWIDFDFYGHQIVTHFVGAKTVHAGQGHVDAKQVPIPHFGVVLTMEDWRALADRLEKSGIEFVMRPQIRFAGQPGEQATMFFLDPSNNAIEVKGFADMSKLFAK